MEHRYIIYGRIIPERTNAQTPPISLSVNVGEPFQVEINLRIEIIFSKIFIHVTTNKEQSPKVLKNAISSEVGALVNYIGFRSMLGLSFAIDSYIYLNTQQTYVFGADEVIFEPQKHPGKFTFDPSPTGIPQEINLHLAFDRCVSRATEELSNAIRYSDYTAMHCWIAIETIRNAFCTDFDAPGWKEAAWKKMREELCLSEKFIKTFHDAATIQKHGRNIPQTWEQRQQSMQIAWECLNRYTLYLLRTDKNIRLNLETL